MPAGKRSMESENTFSYTYTPRDCQEVQAIRSKYLPRAETKLEELKRLDELVRMAGSMEALSIGIGGCLVFGLGMCMAMGVIGQIRWLGVAVGFVGAAGMILAYPVNRKLFRSARARYAPRILQLAEELTVGN